MRRQSTSRRSILSLEQLESRDAPATLISATKLTYQDIDGDNVAITLSKPLLNAGNVNAVFLFDTSNVDGFSNAKQQLQTIDLTGFGVTAAGTGITAVATRGALTGGDGLVNVGYVNAKGIDLGAVTIAGDLGQIRAGDGDAKFAAVTSISLRSMGRFDTVTQAPGGNLHSEMDGALGTLVVKGDVVGASVYVGGGGAGIGSVTISGSLAGGATASGGVIFSAGNIGVVVIGRDLHGGTAAGSGQVNSNGKIASVTVGGSLIGGLDESSGQIHSGGDMGAVKIGHNMYGGSGQASGIVVSEGKLSSVTIGGSLIGGLGEESGRISSTLDMGAVKIVHDMKGGGRVSFGQIFTQGKLAGVTIGGSLIGGSGETSGGINSFGDMGTIKIGGNLLGASGYGSGRVFSGGKLAGASIGGSLIGGVGSVSGGILSVGDMGLVTIGHDVQGGNGPLSGFIHGSRNLAGITVGGSLIGGSGANSGEIQSRGDTGAVIIGHDFIGGSIGGTTADLDRSGSIESLGRIASVAIGGSIYSGIDASTGGGLTWNASIRAGDDIGSLSVVGTVVGNTHVNGDTPVVIAARGQRTVLAGATTDLAIGKIAVAGGVEFARFLAGYDLVLLPPFMDPPVFSPVNADAQIGPVTVGGDWVASSLVAGVSAGADLKFGTADDEKITGGTDRAGIVSKITSITIGGLALGTPNSASTSDAFGFVAQQLGSLKVNGVAFGLAAGAANPGDIVGLAIGFTGDLSARISI